jgi:ankyrin repeat protein
VNEKLSNGKDALMFAAENSEAKIVKRLLEKGADVKASLTEDIPVEGELHAIMEGTNALMMAAAVGDTDSIHELLKAGADISAGNRYGETALMAACAEGHLPAVKLLVANGADVHGRTTEGEIIGAHSHIPKGRSTLSIAVEDGHVDVVRYLLEKGVDVNDKDDVLHMDALFRAARNGHALVAKILIDAGADLYAENRKGGTALNAARHYSHGYIVDMILEARKKAEEEKKADL